MQIMDILTGAQGGAAVSNIARAFNMQPAAAEAALGAITSGLTQRLERTTLSRGGLADLLATLGQGNRERYLDSSGASALGTDAMRADGNAVLEQILGSKNESRKLAERASRDTGLSEDVIKQLLPAVAAMVMGGLAKGAGGALGQVISQIPALSGSPLPLPGEPPRRRAPASDTGPGSDRGPERGSDRGSDRGSYRDTDRDEDRDPNPVSNPDSNRDSNRDWGNPRASPPAGGNVRRGSPLPIPGDDLPGLGRQEDKGRGPLDDLSDILRRGGRGFPGGGRIELPRGPRDSNDNGGDSNAGDATGDREIDFPGAGTGGTLWNIIRSIFGSVLGFESKGFFGWLVRLIVLRWGWGILRRVLGKVLTGR